MAMAQILTSIAAGASVGGVAGWAGKLVQDWFSLEKKRHDALETYVIEHIAGLCADLRATQKLCRAHWIQAD